MGELDGLNELVKIFESAVGLAAALGVVVEITPIKISPLKWIGNRLMAGQEEKIKAISKDVAELKNDFINDKIERLRSELLNFSNSCMNHRLHTEKEFENIFKKEREYNTLCEKHKIENGYTEDNMKYVHEIYRKCKMEGAFLQYQEQE